MTTTITRTEVKALATEVLAHRLGHWGAGPAPKGRVAMHPTETVQCERAWEHVRAALHSGELEAV